MTSLKSPSEGVKPGDQQRAKPGREKANAERGCADQRYPPFEEEKVHRRMKVPGPICDDLFDGGCGQVQADRFVPPDGLNVEVEETQCEGQKTNKEQENCRLWAAVCGWRQR